MNPNRPRPRRPALPATLLVACLAAPPLAAAAPALDELRQTARWGELKAAATAALATSPRDASAHAALVEALWREGRAPQAVAAADRARELGADSPALRLSRASALALLGRWADIPPLLSADMETPAAPTDTLLLTAMALREEGRFEAARQALATLASRPPRDRRVALNLARLELAAGQPSRALAALAAEPGLATAPEGLLLAARARAALGDPAEAVLLLTRALEQEPARASLYALRARELARLQRWPAAATDIHSALLLGAQEADDYLLACEVARMIGDHGAMAAYARAGLGRHPQRVELAQHLVLALREGGKLEEALAVATAARKAFPDSPALQLEAALVETARANPAGVITALDPLLAREPSAQAFVLRAFARLKLGQLPGAGEDAGNALVLSPGLASALVVQAGVALAQGRPELAEGPCRQALLRDPQSAWAHTTCGEVALALGRADEAQALVARALRLAPDDQDAQRLQARLRSPQGRLP